MAALSCIIPTYQRQRQALSLVRALARQTYRDAEIIVVDQTPERCPELESCPSIRYVRAWPPSLPNARNVGARNATGRVLLFLDDDIEADPQLFEFHMANYDDPTISGVAGRITGGYDERMRGPTGAFRVIDAYVLRNFGAETRCEVQVMPGGNMSIRREVWERVGGFEPAFAGSSLGEESDFCLRARAAGFRFVFDPRAKVQHLHLPTGGCREPRFDRWLYWMAHNTMLLGLRHIPWNFLPVVVLERTLRFAMFALESGRLALIGTGLRGIAGALSTYLRLRRSA